MTASKRNQDGFRNPMSKWINPDGTRMDCPIINCGRKIYVGGYCKSHYEAKRTGRELSSVRNIGQDPDCSIEGCIYVAHSRLLCITHYRHWLYSPEQMAKASVQKCPVPVCDKTIKTTSVMCKNHKRLGTRYSIPDDKLLKMFDEYVCGNFACESSEDLHVDHDHSCCWKGKHPGTKKSCGDCVRGWLCRGCNMSLGAMKDDIKKLEGLIAYLKQSSPLEEY